MKNNIIFISISLGLIILLGIGFSYSLWNISVSQDTTNLAESKCFDLSITNKENNINLDNAYPISNDKGKGLTPYTFTITNTCDITAEYSVNLEVLNNSTLASKFIDVMFEGNINLLSSYDNTDKVNTSSIESRKLTTGILKSKESKDYSLRLWIDYNTTLEDLNNEIKSFKSKIVVVGKPINYTGDTVFNFDYTGSEQTFIAPVSGTYRLETWGAQGGSHSVEKHGGYGGYSYGAIYFKNSDNLFINVGGQGIVNNSDVGKITSGGYNGGGNTSADAKKYLNFGSSGGGATHVSSKSGVLSTLENYNNNIFIVSGGGGGSNYDTDFLLTDGIGGSGGGIIGNSGTSPVYNNNLLNGAFATGGTQNSFGIGANSPNVMMHGKNGAFGLGGDSATNSGAGGGGFYGGGGGAKANDDSSGAGGSGYIGNSLLTNKVMYCYNCEESNEESTKTISTTCNEETPTSYCAKKGNGYARITLVSIDE